MSIEFVDSAEIIEEARKKITLESSPNNIINEDLYLDYRFDDNFQEKRYIKHVVDDEDLSRAQTVQNDCRSQEKIMKESGSEKNLKLHENEPLLPEPRRDLLGGTLNSKLKKGRVKTRKQSYEEPHSDVIYPKILNQKSSKPNKKERLKLEVERKGYLKHIKNLRLAHKVTLK